MKFVQLSNNLKERIDPVYLIEGEDAYFRDHAVSAIRQACGITQPVFNESRFDGESHKGDLAGFFAGLFTLPLLDGKRLVCVYGFYPTEREWEKYLKPYAEHPCSSTVLVIVNKRKKAGAVDLKRKSAVTFVDCGRESEETLGKWLFGVMRRSALNADVDAVTLMVRYCAQDAARMKRETEKLALILGEGGRVTRREVEEYVAKDTEYKVYELTQAASRKNYSAFSEILDDLMKKGFDEHAVLSALVSHYRTLCEVLELKGSDAEAASVFGVKPYAVQRNRETANRLGRQKVTELYLYLYELSCGAKGGLYTKSGALTQGIAKIFFS